MNAPLGSSLPGVRPLPRRGARLDLAFRRVGSRTRIGRQFAAYPFHLTRGFDLDEAIPGLTTVYLQSCSGGLYRGERLETEISVGPEAAVHVTSQAATIVHDAGGEATVQDVVLSLDTGAFLAFTPDPLILFPGARLAATLTVRRASGAVALLSDIIAEHRPAGAARRFDRYDSAVRVEDDDGRLLVSDRMAIDGADFSAALGGGRWTAAGTAFLLGAPADLPSAEAIGAALDGPQAIGGVTALPNDAGYAVRMLATGSGVLRQGMADLFGVIAERRFGARPAERRK